MRVVYSPLDCLKIAHANPDKQVVFFAIGFETTAPANAMLVIARQAAGRGKHLAAGVACAGAAGDSGDPAISGEPRAGISWARACVRGDGLSRIRADQRAIPCADRDHRLRAAGSPARDADDGSATGAGPRRSRKPVLARFWIARATRRRRSWSSSVFEVGDRNWRGIGTIPAQRLSPARRSSRHTTPSSLFDVAKIDTREPEICISGEILQGIKKPHDCPAFGTHVTPQHPLGATMVSAEGACAAYYAYGRHLERREPDHKLTSIRSAGAA